MSEQEDMRGYCRHFGMWEFVLFAFLRWSCLLSSFDAAEDRVRLYIGRVRVEASRTHPASWGCGNTLENTPEDRCISASPLSLPWR